MTASGVHIARLKQPLILARSGANAAMVGGHSIRANHARLSLRRNSLAFDTHEQQGIGGIHEK